MEVSWTSYTNNAWLFLGKYRGGSKKGGKNLPLCWEVSVDGWLWGNKTQSRHTDHNTSKLKTHTIKQNLRPKAG